MAEIYDSTGNGASPTEQPADPPKRGWPKGKPRGPRKPKTGIAAALGELEPHPMPAELRCDGCAHYFQLQIAGGAIDQTQGACRRYPPIFIGMQLMFPSVKSEWWCGEHRPARS